MTNVENNIVVDVNKIGCAIDTILGPKTAFYHHTELELTMKHFEKCGEYEIRNRGTLDIYYTIQRIVQDVV